MYCFSFSHSVTPVAFSASRSHNFGAQRGALMLKRVYELKTSDICVIGIFHKIVTVIVKSATRFCEFQCDSQVYCWWGLISQLLLLSVLYILVLLYLARRFVKRFVTIIPSCDAHGRSTSFLTDSSRWQPYWGRQKTFSLVLWYIMWSFKNLVLLLIRLTVLYHI